MQAIIQTVVNWFSALFAWIGRFFEWWGGMLKDLFEFLTDIPLFMFKGVMEGVLYLINAIPVPEFLTQYRLQVLFDALPDTVTYFVSYFGIPQGLAILGLGVTFRLTRKAFTLGQW